MLNENTAKITIPYIDIREGSPVDLMKDHKEKAVNILKGCRNAAGITSRVITFFLFPMLDYFSKRWLKRTNNPYQDEITACAKAVGTKGLYAINLSYEWGCTTGAFTQPSGTTLARVLDWPFPEMGENIVVAHQKGPAGEFHNVTWPGLSGIFNATAAGRFSAAINQAPMRRGWTGVVTDWFRNHLHINKENALPPEHLLRKAFENAADYQAAKKMLSTEPIAAPVIYILAGVKPDEGCVIERLENKAIIREIQEGRVCASNHFETSLNGNGQGWMARRDCSGPRVEQARAMPLSEIDDKFTWFKAPIANVFSKLALVADAAQGTLQVMGVAGEKPVTKIFKL